MRKPILVLVMTLVALSAPHAEDGQMMRYRDPSGRVSLTVNQEIEVPDHGVVAGRDFAFDLEVGAEPVKAVTVTIEKARASYEAHGMKERLGVRHLIGQSFTLPIGDAGRSLGPPGDDVPTIDLGPMVGTGFSVADLLAETLPVLPEGTVSVGASWTTERPVRSLEGWGYGTGHLTCRHRLTSVERQGERTVVKGETDGSASLASADGERGFTGDLKRTLHWSFDATDGRLIFLSMEQETRGETSLPKGETTIIQRTRVELAPRGPGSES